MRFGLLFHRHDPNEPCPFMEKWLNRSAEGRAGWLARLYVRLHTARCGPCRRFIERLNRLLAELRGARAPDPSPDALNRLMAVFESSKG